MSVIHAPKGPNVDARSVVFPAGLALAMGTLFFRLWYYQVARADEFSAMAEAARYTDVEKLAPRGLIFDRKGILVAGVRPQIVVTAIPAIVDKPENDWVYDKLVQILGGATTREKLEAKVEEAKWRPFLATPIFVGADIAAGTRIAELHAQLPGIGVETQPMRYYPDTVSLSHLLGHVAAPIEQDVARFDELDLDLAPVVGRDGIERAFESDLLGIAGYDRVEVDSHRRPIRDTTPNKAIPGRRLTLSIDLELQRYALDLLRLHGYVGAIAAIDPNNGEALCLASNPTYDVRAYENKNDYNAIATDPNHPFINRCLKSAYAPGSTFKIITSLAAYETGHFAESNTYFCPGGMQAGKRFVKCLGQHGQIGYHRALVKSCNTYFFNLGKAAGPDALRKAAFEFGLGKRTGVELGGSPGVVPTEEYIKKVRKPAKWYFGDTLNFSIGQGFVNTTPLQMANVAAQVANEGVRYRPHIVTKVEDVNDPTESKTIAPEIVSKIDAQPEFWRALKSGLLGVVAESEGTATAARLPDVSIAGKTGSAEHMGKKTHAWFIGYAPAEAPKIAFCVFIEDAGHGGDVAAPVAREFLDHFFKISLAKPANRSASSAASPASAALPRAR